MNKYKLYENDIYEDVPCYKQINKIDVRSKTRRVPMRYVTYLPRKTIPMLRFQALSLSKRKTMTGSGFDAVTLIKTTLV